MDKDSSLPGPHIYMTPEKAVGKRTKSALQLARPLTWAYFIGWSGSTVNIIVVLYKYIYTHVYNCHCVALQLYWSFLKIICY